MRHIFESSIVHQDSREFAEESAPIDGPALDQWTTEVQA